MKPENTMDKQLDQLEANEASEERAEEIAVLDDEQLDGVAGGARIQHSKFYGPAALRGAMLTD